MRGPASQTAVSDLSPLQGMPLRLLSIWYTPAERDLTPLVGLPLERLCLGTLPGRKGIDLMRKMRSLKYIGSSYDTNAVMQAEEFWRKYDAGEFK